jgi:putative glycerol-1-phosphate prenyltransferase
LIIGGGIRSAETAIQLYKAGADVLVIGNGVEDNHQLIQSIANAKQALIDSIA